MNRPGWLERVWGTTTVRPAFVGMSLLFGCILIFLVPPFQSPDEPNHFLRAWQISEGIFVPETQDRRLGGTLPASLAEVRDSFSYLKMNYDARLRKGLIIRCLGIPLDAEKRTFLDFPNTAIYAPTAYLPQAAAIALLRPLGATPLQILYAVRLSNLFAWVLLVAAAIRLMPFLKHAMAGFALLPASLVIAASANADVTTNGLCWWLIAGFCAGKLPDLKTTAGLAITCANKLIALPLALLFWLFPAGGMKRFTLLFVFALAAALSWGALAQKWFIPYDAYHPAHRDAQTLNEGVDPAGQQAFIFNNPLYFSKIATVSALKALPSAAAHVAGKFGWEKNYLPPAWLAVLWLALATLLASAENPLSRQQRWLAAGTAMLYCGMFSITMYALWCPVGAEELTNFQGRYFVPILPVLALAVGNGWLRRFEKQVWLGMLLILAFSNLALIFSILERYYFAF